MNNDFLRQSDSEQQPNNGFTQQSDGEQQFNSYFNELQYQQAPHKTPKKGGGKWGGELRKHFSKERCSQTAMPFFAVFPLYFGLFLSPVQNQMHR